MLYKLEIKTIGGNNMRLRNVKNKEEILNNCPYLIKKTEEFQGKWNTLFNNNNPIYIEIGMGKGKFLLENALKNSNIKSYLSRNILLVRRLSYHLFLGQGSEKLR